MTEQFDPNYLRIQQLKETALQRKKAFNQLYKQQYRERMKQMQNINDQNQKQQREYEEEVRRIKFAHDVQLKARQAYVWAALPTAEDEAELFAHKRASESERDKTHLQQFDQLTEQRNQNTFAKKRLEEQLALQNKQAEYEKKAELRRAQEERTRNVIEKQKIYNLQRQKALQEEEEYRKTMEYKLQNLNTKCTEILQQPGLPTYVTDQKTVKYEVIYEHPGEAEDGMAADAFHEATVRQQTAQQKVWPSLDTTAFKKEQKVNKLASEGISILEAIQRL